MWPNHLDLMIWHMLVYPELVKQRMYGPRPATSAAASLKLQRAVARRSEVMRQNLVEVDDGRG